MHRTLTNPGICPRCLGELEFGATVERREKGSDVYFFRCKDCGLIDTVPLKDNDRSSVASN